MIYLACPYTGVDSAERLRLVSLASYELIRCGELVFSPLNMSCGILKELGLPDGGWEFWREWCLGMVGSCDRVMVLTLPGWESSIGVRAEVLEAERLGIPVEYVEAT